MKFPQQLIARWTAMPIGRRIGMLAAVLVTIVGGSMVWSRVNQPTWAVLYSNLDDAQASAVLGKLDAKGISHRVDGNGTRISVPKDKLVQARIDLAADGVSGRTVPAGWSILDKEGLATSDLRQRVDYQRALEGELAKTLMSMNSVSVATVHLTLPEKPIFAGASTDAAKPTASVLLGLRRPLTTDETDTVANVVASAVEDLTVANVTVASTDGAILHAPGDTAGNGGVTTAKAFKATRDYEAARSTELSALATQLTQQPGAQVVVRADLDFSESTVESETYDPTKQVKTATQTDVETWTGTGGTAAGGTTGVDGGPLPNGANSTNGNYQHNKDTTQFGNDRTVTKTVQGGAPKVKKLSVAVVVPFDENGNGPAVDEAAIKRVIGAAAGIDATRGDTIEVATVPATVVATTVPAAATPVPAGGLPVPAVAGAGGGLFVVFLLFMMRSRKRKKKAKAKAIEALNQLQAAGEAGGLNGTWMAGGAGAGGAAMAPAVAATKQETDAIRADLDRMANETPESLAALLSTWLTKN